jgi:hypothetical protein
METVAASMIEALEAWRPSLPLETEAQLRLALANVLEVEADRIGRASSVDIRVLCEGPSKRSGAVQIVPMHILRGSFWPDITVVEKDGTNPVMAVEAKLLQHGAGPVATSVGQALFYRYGKPCVGRGKTRIAEGHAYPRVVVFIVDQRGETVGSEDTPDQDAAIKSVLTNLGVNVITRRPNQALHPTPAGAIVSRRG